MLKLRLEWQQKCNSCNTDLVLDVYEAMDGGYPCPWCGQPVRIDMGDGQKDKVKKLLQKIQLLETETNSDLSK
jgi:transcription initiation factor IIE alpha subunit